MPSVPMPMPSVTVGVPNICGIAAGLLERGHRRVGQRLQAGVAGRDRRVAVGDADHRLVEVAVLVADGAQHRAVGRARDALGDDATAAVVGHADSGAREQTSVIPGLFRCCPMRVGASAAASVSQLRGHAARGVIIPHARSSAVRSRRASARPARRALVRPHLPARASSCSWSSASTARAQNLLTGWTRATSTTCCSTASSASSSAAGSATCCSTSRLLPGASAGDLALWKGGMCFHGGLLGVIIALALFARNRQQALARQSPTSSRRCCRSDWPPAASATSSTASCGGASDRRAVGDGLSASGHACRAIRRSSTSSRWKGSPCSRCSGSSRGAGGRCGAVSALFLIGYGMLRFIVEFSREPDNFLGLLALGMSHGAVAVAADDRRRAW